MTSAADGVSGAPPPVGAPLECAFFARPVLEVAPDLIGCTFLFDGVGGRHVEVEAYRRDDPASHSYRGRTVRNAVMFGPPGRLYVYFTMGLHFCVNVVCQGEGEAAAVLLRALEPTRGLELIRARRSPDGRSAHKLGGSALDDLRRLCSGPAKLTQALAITRADDGAPACEPGERFGFFSRDAGADEAGGPGGSGDVDGASLHRAPRIVTTTRIGVTAGAERPWRFVDADSAFLSRPLPRRLRPGRG